MSLAARTSAIGLRLAVVVIATAALAVCFAAAAQPEHAHGAHEHFGEHAHHLHEPPAPVAEGATQVRLLDLPLITQHDKELRFASEAVGERVVVMGFVYTSCTTVCPIVSAVLAQLQERLGTRLGEEVALLTLSVDPTTDTPQRLAEYAERYGTRPGWLWLTGRKPMVDRVLQGLGAYTADYVNHPAMVLVGDARAGTWTRLYGFPDPDALLAHVDALLAARHQHERAAKLE
jgi:protein SCO1